MWNPGEHSDEENLRWCWLRAVEWGNWPAFISQPIVPIALLFWPWKVVVATTVVASMLWALLIRHSVVVVPLAYWGAFFVRLKWIACPLAAYVLYRERQSGLAVLAFLWPAAVMIIGPFLMPQVGRIQKMFMQCLGYEPKERSR